MAMPAKLPVVSPLQTLQCFFATLSNHYGGFENWLLERFFDCGDRIDILLFQHRNVKDMLEKRKSQSLWLVACGIGYSALGGIDTRLLNECLKVSAQPGPQGITVGYLFEGPKNTSQVLQFEGLKGLSLLGRHQLCGQFKTRCR
ncbi:MAG TPA: hypothetical protein V6C81_01400 [Planktothrix sp.]|jgi:hypothetical protein